MIFFISICTLHLEQPRTFSKFNREKSSLPPKLSPELYKIIFKCLYIIRNSQDTLAVYYIQYTYTYIGCYFCIFISMTRNWISVFDGRDVWTSTSRSFYQVSMAFAPRIYAFFWHDGTLFRHSRTAIEHFFVYRHDEPIQRRSAIQCFKMVPGLSCKYSGILQEYEQCSYLHYCIIIKILYVRGMSRKYEYLSRAEGCFPEDGHTAVSGGLFLL